MKNIIGFGIESNSINEETAMPQLNSTKPVRSLVSVRFIQDGRSFTYYNDQFALEVGDYVFVSGKLAGQLGIVETLTTKFKIKLSDYQRVVGKATVSIHGSYESILDKMVSYDSDALSSESFRTSILAPRHWKGETSGENGDEIIIGDGYELCLENIENEEDVSQAVFDRAIDYCREGKVVYVAIRDGIGTAYVDGTSWYEVNFTLHGDEMKEIYCDCPYPGLCKHLLAVALTIRALAKIGKINLDRDLVAIDETRFWSLVARSTKRITL